MARLKGVFGGTFDPPHVGHLILAAFALEALGLEEVLWVLTPRSPLKPEADIAPAPARARMIEAAIASEPRFKLSRVDLDRPGPHYAADTFERLAAAEPQTGFVYLMGSDGLSELPRWQDPDRLIRGCAGLGVMRRPGFDPDVASLDRVIPGLARKVQFFEAPLVAISGRAIRSRCSKGLTVRYLVPDAVLEIVAGENLYGGDLPG